jgi:Calcineurin-like phosphoesterase
MSIVRNNHRKRSLTRRRTIISFGSIFILALVIATTFSASAQSRPLTPQAGGSFSFTAAGDYGQTNYTTANLKYIAQSGVNFNLALGDFSYDPSVSAATWSAYAKSLLPANFPFEILPGGHDTSNAGENTPNDINTYVADLPDHMGNVTGTYGKQYAFDYPTSNPLARFILISPGEVLNGYDYSKGSADYNWVSQEIDSARAANIHWVIVAMHQYCFVIDSASCASQDLLDLLLSKHVDLILQAQKHTYQASKQLALNGTTCTTLSDTHYNPNCVVNSTTNMTKGDGSVIVVTGTGGTVPQLAINTSDPKIGYFRSWMGANVNQTWGVSQFTISATQLSMHFINVSGSFTDGFSING